VVAALIHYFILVVFCWTACELINANMILFTESYNGFFQTIYFFLILCWGESTVFIYLYCRRTISTGIPIPIVAIAAGILHDDYGIYDEYKQKRL